MSDKKVKGWTSAIGAASKKSGAAKNADLWLSDVKGEGKGKGSMTIPTCSHTGDIPVWEGPRGITISGARASQADLVDAEVLVDLSGSISSSPGNRLSGDKELVKALEKHTGHPRLLKIHWPDYSAPSTLHAPFWSALWSTLPDGARATFCCLGSHGRTGTALASMILVDSASRLGVALDGYEAADVVRQRHCSKAVESATQETYLAKLAAEAALAAKLIEKSTAPAMIATAKAKFDAAFQAKHVVPVAVAQSKLDWQQAPAKPIKLTERDLADEVEYGGSMFDDSPLPEAVGGAEVLRRDGRAPNGRALLAIEFVNDLEPDAPLTKQGVTAGDAYLDPDGDVNVAMPTRGGIASDVEFIPWENLDDADLALIETMVGEAVKFENDDVEKLDDDKLPGWSSTSTD